MQKKKDQQVWVLRSRKQCLSHRNEKRNNLGKTFQFAEINLSKSADRTQTKKKHSLPKADGSPFLFFFYSSPHICYISKK